MQLVITQNITLDGVIDATEGWFEAGTPSDAHWDLNQEHMREESAFLTGRITFEQMRGYWPTLTDDTTGITDHLNAVDKYVVSESLDDPEWENTTVLPTVGDVADLKRTREGQLGATGSIKLCHALLRAGLVDELRLFHYPVVLGTGRRLWPEGVKLPRLELLDARDLGGGVHYTAHRVSG
jgi:dihydrofolate reductase